MSGPIVGLAVGAACLWCIFRRQVATSILWSLLSVEVFSRTAAPSGNSFEVLAGRRIKSMTAARGALLLPVKVVRADQVVTFIMLAGRRSRVLTKARKWRPHIVVRGISVFGSDWLGGYIQSVG